MATVPTSTAVPAGPISTAATQPARSEPPLVALFRGAWANPDGRVEILGAVGALGCSRSCSGPTWSTSFRSGRATRTTATAFSSPS